MPTEFDPEWEYFTGDPEVEELIERSGRGITLYDNLRQALSESGRATPRWSHGFAVIKHPDRRYTVLGKERKSWGRPRVRPYIKDCRGCGKPFDPDRADRRYCSWRCVPHPGPGKRLTGRECRGCGKAFQPVCSKHVFCTHPCASKHKRHARPGGDTLREFAEMYLRGDPVKAICDRFGISVPATKDWRRYAGIPPRPVGRPKTTGTRKRVRNRSWPGRVWARLVDNEGINPSELAIMLGISRHAVGAGVYRGRKHQEEQHRARHDQER